MNKRFEMLEKMIAKGSTDPFVWYARALELESAGEQERALAAFGEVRTRFPDYVPTYLMAGQLALALGRSDEARAFLERGVEAATAAGDEHALSEIRRALDTL
jgi:tetratricopeptide (TPR) repeat protein